MRLPVRSAPLVSFAFLTVAALALLAACDTGGPGDLAPEAEPAEPPAVHADSLTLEVSPMPVGAKLLPPGTAQPGAATRAKKGGASPYGCYLASRPYTDKVRFHSVYLDFPRGVVKAAGGETERLIFRLRAVQEGRTDTTGVRYAHCVIPKGKAAQKLTMRQVVRVGETGAVREATRHTEKRARSKGSCTVVATAIMCVGDYCWVDDFDTICSGGAPGGNPDGGGTQPTVPYPGTGNDESGGGGDGSGGGSGGTCEQLEPPPGSDCEPVDPTAGWGKAINIGKKMIKAAKRGEDLLDAKTWKNMLESEWADAAQAGLDVQAALNGDVIALLSVLDYIAEQVVGFGFFDMLQILKHGDHLGLSWYDDAVGYLTSSKHFARFANSIDDLDMLKQVGRLDVEENGAYKILKGDAGKVMDNFAEKWGTNVYQRADGTWEVLKPGGNVRMTQYRSSSVINGKRRPTINLNESGSTQKIRFGDSKYPYE